jgi:hypothetical protein
MVSCEPENVSSCRTAYCCYARNIIDHGLLSLEPAQNQRQQPQWGSRARATACARMPCDLSVIGAAHRNAASMNHSVDAVQRMKNSR